MSNEEVNLDHVLISFRHRSNGTVQVTYPLHQFLRRERYTSVHRVASDFDYEEFRSTIHDQDVYDEENEIYLPPVDGGEAFAISKKEHFWVFFTYVQAGKYNEWIITNSHPPTVIIYTPDRLNQQPSPDDVMEKINPPPGNPEAEDPNPGPKEPRPKNGDRGGRGPGGPKQGGPKQGGPKQGRPKQGGPKQDRPKQGGPEVIEIDDESDEGNAGEPSFLDEVNEVDDSGSEADPLPTDGQLVDRLGVNLHDPINPSWQAAAKFFGIDEDDTFAVIPGLKRNPLDHQLYAAYYILTRPLHNINTAIIADDVGLGKTNSALLTAYIYHRLHVAMVEVDNQWEGRPAARGPLHFSHQDIISEDSVCPLQVKWGFQCPCLRREAYDIAQKLGSNPTVIACPPDLIRGWMAEVDKSFDLTQGSPARDMVFMQYSTSTFYKNSPAVLETESKVEENITSRQRYEIVYPLAEDLKSRYVIICSRLVPENLRKCYERDVQFGRTTQRNVSHFNATLVFMDEVHGYKGTTAGPTIPFQFVRKIDRDSPDPTVIVGLSASMLSDGPKAWGAFVHHMFRSTDAKIGIPELRSEDDLRQHRVDFDFLVGHLESLESNNENEQAAAQVRFDNVRGFLRAFLPRIMLRRVANTLFNGHLITRPPRDIVTIITDTPDGSVREAQKALAESVRSWVGQIYNQRVREWDEGGRMGTEPDRKTVQENVLSCAINNTPGLKINRAYEIILRSSCFPAIAELIRSEQITYEQILTSAVREISEEITKAFGGPAPGSRPQNADAIDREVRDIIQKSPFYAHRNLLRNNSPKLAQVCRYIEHILSLQEHDWTAASGFPDPGTPDDGSKVRHCLIFTETQLSSFLLFMLLYRRFAKRVEWHYIHAGLSGAQRGEIVQRMQEPCRVTDKTKILISTFSLLGTGHNIQRANYCIITEMPRSLDIQNQAKGRIDRTGQVQEPNSVQLYDTRNLAETVRYNRSMNRARLVGDGGVDGIDLSNFV
ncbi:uncharacterized protein GGS22DRAFT_198120 [Annulohypoxylon maeteangense]|uniref:uncharacterized protein n=1 Tax=Annulohypoxylon maeteangense TaxID=1927788 RepID=UPI0020077EA8|nr:uncharacterized protein GGS22DRAFT_198120 [Annulohypoxylon maeteangense]KAI0888345.1 hypothetical protein GGS22DRAFT_198120 [Annulohypoxylon maeteangense]